MNLLQLVMTAAAVTAALSAIMTIAWRVQQTTRHAGWVDAFWTGGVGAAGAITALIPFGAGPWPRERQVLVAVLGAIWSLRLGWHIIMRIRATSDDPRYRQLITEWGSDAGRRMFWFLQTQAAFGVVFALSIALAAQNPHPRLRLEDLVGGFLLAAGIVGENFADRQLRQFKVDPANRNAVCDIGLWR
jgi:steroid 5-alpha reductase family enzyme